MNVFMSHSKPTRGDPEMDPPSDSLVEDSGVFFLASFKAAFVPELRAELINCNQSTPEARRTGRGKGRKQKARISNSQKIAMKEQTKEIKIKKPLAISLIIAIACATCHCIVQFSHDSYDIEAAGCIDATW